MIYKTTFDDVNIISMWKDPEMWGDSDFKAVSSMKYYDGIDHMGGNDMAVYDEEYSKPTFYIDAVEYAHSGCVSTHIVDNTVRVRGLFVKEKYRGQGISEQLLRHVIKHTKCDTFMWALAGPNSMHVHEKVGFVPVTEQYHQMPDGNVSKHHNCYMRYDP